MPWQHVNNWPGGLTAIHAALFRNSRLAVWGLSEAGRDAEGSHHNLNETEEPSKQQHKRRKPR